MTTGNATKITEILRENETEKTPELLRMGEKNSHNRKQLWEDGITLEPWIFKRTDQDLEENSSLVFKMLGMKMRTTMTNYETLRDEN